ncbi:aldehyde dehydrogenase family protein [Haloglycomyces albus]|uniref:aldehyde dehydrogenase family protein n=1 Tax=Haloglycomyces albus TaxID=526067 RepID=UPI00046CFA21|nr:aldehyde dehydrogenase family protein [Haloglycomyces albus]
MFDYSPAPESAPAHINDHYGLFIDGEFVEADGDQVEASINPATGAELFTYAGAGSTDVVRAVAAARKAQADWAALPGLERGKYLYRIARLLQERGREFAVAESMDNGKPIRESRDFDIPQAAQHFFYHAGWADKLDYVRPGAQPLGVAGQIIPWNFPLLMLAWKIAPALAAGNTVVLKPAETTPLTALKFAELCQEAELPRGVVNIVGGGPQTGTALVESDVEKLAFTGSTGVGRRIAQSIAGSDKRLTLELGGKGANVVFDDAALDQAVEGVLKGVFFNQGHVCCAGSRLLVQENIAEEVVERLKTRLSTLRLGDPLDKNTDIGAVNSGAQLDRIRQLVEQGREEGARLWDTGTELPTEGFWHRPTIFTDVQQSHSVAQEEIFGPVLSVLTFRTPQEAMVKANNTPYGLAAGVWTSDAAKLNWAADKLRAGIVWANTYNRFDPASPFGGMKESGYGREGGLQGLEAYLK